MCCHTTIEAEIWLETNLLAVVISNLTEEQYIEATIYFW